MTPTALAASAQLSIRALTRDDLDDVVALDAALEGHVRRAYFQRRLASAIAQPGQHLQLAAVDAQGLAGHLLARRTSGEFGRASPGLRLEVIGVRSDLRGQGVGTQLLQALIGHGQRHGVAELRTTAAWTSRGRPRGAPCAWPLAPGWRWRAPVPSPARKATNKGCCCLLYTSPSPRDRTRSRMPSAA